MAIIRRAKLWSNEIMNYVWHDMLPNETSEQLIQRLNVQSPSKLTRGEVIQKQLEAFKAGIESTGADVTTVQLAQYLEQLNK